MPDAGSSRTYDDEQLVRYLIGSLNEQETERFDELSISDDEFAGRLRAVENDLIDAHARGELSRETRARFEAHYLSRPGKPERMRFAEAWTLRQRRAVSARATGSRSSLSDRPARHRFVWPLAAAAAVVLAVLGYVLLARPNPSGPPSQGPASTVATEPPKSVPSGPGPGSTGTLPAPIAIVLMPSTRGTGEMPSLLIPAGSTAVEVSLVLDGDDFPTYDVALKDFGSDRALWNRAGLRSSSSGGDRIVVAAIDVSVLKSQRYALELSGRRTSGRAEVITSYPFRVVVK
jgi:hypothetical protein